MDSNNPNLNPKQEELVKRLEEIRRKRNARSTTTKANDSLEGTSLEQQKEPRNRKQKRNQNRKQNRKQQTEYIDQIPPQTEGVSLESTSLENKYSPQRNRNKLLNKQASVQNKAKKQNGRTLIEQLSDRKELRDAIILSEILSKPVALKKRYR